MDSAEKADYPPPTMWRDLGSGANKISTTIYSSFGSEALLVTLAQDLAYHPSLPTQEIIRRAPLFFRIVFSWSVFVRVRVLIWACENSHFYFI